MRLPAVIHILHAGVQGLALPPIGNESFWVLSQQGAIKAVPSGKWETTFGTQSCLYGRAIIEAATPCWHGLPFWQIQFNTTFADGDSAKTVRLCR